MEAHAEPTGEQAGSPAIDPDPFSRYDTGELEGRLEPEPDTIPGRVAARSGSSLRERMLARKREVESRTTQLFPVPHYDVVLAVELQVIDWERTEKIIQKHLRAQRRQMLLNAADEIVAATVAFHEIRDDGSTDLIEDARTWGEIAEAFLDESLPDAPHATRERVALIAVASDQGVMSLSGTYRQWMGGASVGLREEVVRDFGTTT